MVSGYALAFGMVPIIGGRLGDDRGRKRMLLIGIAAFVVFSALVGLAPDPGVIIVGRVLQGLAGGLLNPQVSGIVQQLFPPAERGKAFGAIGAAVGIATAAGPVVGGAIIALGGPEFGWRLCFLVNVPVGHRVAAPVRPAAAGDPARGRHRAALDLPGVGPAQRRGVRPAVPGGASSTPTTTCGWAFLVLPGAGRAGRVRRLGARAGRAGAAIR